MKDFHNDIYMYFEYDQQSNKYAFQKNVIGPEAARDIDEADYTYTDSNSIFVDSDTGSDTNAGTQAAPKETLLAAINACTSTKTKVIVLNTALYAEELDTVDNSTFEGIYAATGETPTYTVRVLDYIPADANSIFVSADAGSPGAAGTQADPFDTITEAIAACDGTHQAVVIMDSATYEEPGFEFTGNFKKLVAALGQNPTVEILHNSSFIDSISQRTAWAGISGNTLAYLCSDGLKSSNSIIYAYRDATDANKGKFTIIDYDGNVVKAATEFDANTVNYVDVASFSDGSFVIVYWDAVSSISEFAIYDKLGNSLISSTQISSGSIQFCRVAVRPDDTFIVIADDGKYGIYNKAGAVVISRTSFASVLPVANAVRAFSNNYFVIAYEASVGGSFFQIFDSDGNVSVAETSIDAIAIGQSLTIAVSDNDRWGLAYVDSTSSSKFDIYDIDGNSILDSQFSANASADRNIDAFNNLFLIYFNDSSVSKDKYVIFDDDGNEVAAPAISKNVAINYPTCSFFANGNFSLAHCVVAAAAQYSVYYEPRFDGIKISTDSIINGISFFYDQSLMYRMIRGNSAEIDMRWCNIIGSYNLSRESYALYSNDNADIYNCIISDNDQGVYVASNTVVIDDCLFYRNDKTGYAIHINGAAASSSDISITHCTFFENYSAIRLQNNHGTNEIMKNNIIHDNSVYGVLAETAATISYSINTDVLSGVTNGSSVIQANPLFINEGAETPADTDLQIKLRVLGYPVNSPAYLLADDTSPDRDAGAWNITPIGEAATWTGFQVEKPGDGISITQAPTGETKLIKKDGSMATRYEAWTEEVSIRFKGILNADYDNFMLMLNCGNSTIRFYPDYETNPTEYDVYTLIYKEVDASADHYRLTATGREGFRIVFSRAYEP